MKKPTKLGSVSPSHNESCKDLEPFISRSPQTPPLDHDKDDYHDKTCPGKTCLETAEELARSPAGSDGGGRRSAAAASGSEPAVAGRSPMPCSSPAKPPPPPPKATGM